MFPYARSGLITARGIIHARTWRPWPIAAAHSVSGSSKPSAVLTEVFDRASPPEVVQAKIKELQSIGPFGWQRAIVYAAVCVPLWLTNAIMLGAQYVTRPGDMLKQPDPSKFKLVPPFPLHEEYITVNGIKLHAVSPGRNPDKPLMLMLHGFPECWYSWRHQMAAFAQDYDVVAIDMRGYNTSDKPQGLDSYHLRQLAADVKAAVAALGHDSCTLMAHDWGGSVAWVTASLYGQQLVQQLIVMGLPHLGVMVTNMSGDQYMRSLYMLSFQAPVLAELMISGDDAAIMQKAFQGDTQGVQNKAAMTAQDVSWFRQAMCQPGAATATLNYYRAFMRFLLFSDPQDAIWGALKRPLEMPVLVLHGESDVALGLKLLDGIEAVLPQGTVKVLKNCSHWVQQDYPDQVNNIVQDWLTTQQQQQQQPVAEQQQEQHQRPR